jgi:hypothetical protein
VSRGFKNAHQYWIDTPEYITIAEDVGFTMALTTAYGQVASEGKIMQVPRVRVHGGGDGLEKLQKLLVGK